VTIARLGTNAVGLNSLGLNSLGLGLLLGLVLFSSRSPVLAVVCVAFAGFLVALLALGTERLGTLVIIAATFTGPINHVQYGRPIPNGPVTWSDLFLAVGFLVLAPTMLSRRTRVPMDWAVGAFLVVAGVLISSALSPEPAVGLNYGLRLVAAAVVLPLAMLLWRPPRETVEKLAWAYVFGHVLSTTYAILTGPAVNGRYAGLTSHVNFFALAGLLSAGVLVHKWYVLRPEHRWLVLACAPFCLFSIWFSGSRAALLVLVVVAIVVPVVERTAMSAFAVLAGGAGAIASASWLISRASEGSALARLKGDSSTTGSDQERKEALALGFDKFLAHPAFGKSFGEDALAAHNIYLEVAVGIGLLGLIGFLLIGFCAVRPLFGSGPLHRLGYVALAFGGVGMITNSLWDRFTWTALVLGILASVDEDETSSRSREPHSEPRQPVEAL